MKLIKHITTFKLKKILSIISFEVIFVLFLFAGLYKADPRLGWVPFDLTAFFWCISVIWALAIVTQKRFPLKRKSLTMIVIFACLAFWIIFSLIWTPGKIYAESKTFYVCTLVLWSLVAPAIVISTDSVRLKRLGLVFFLLSLTVAIEAFGRYILLGPNSFITVFGSNYLGLGRVIGLALVLVIAFFLFWAEKWYQKAGAFLIVVIYSWILLISGGRGPLLAAALAAIVPLFFGVQLNAGKLKIKRFMLAFSILFIISIAFIAGSNEDWRTFQTISRISYVVESGWGYSAGSRLTYFSDAIELWSDSPVVGHGIGSWPLLVGLSDARAYPHNILLELLVELGILGFIIFISLIIYSMSLLKPLKKIANEPLKLLLIMMFTVTFINSMVSGDIPDNRMLFSCIGLMPAAMNNRKRPEIYEK